MKVDQRDSLTDSRDGAVSVVSLVLAVLAAYKILTYMPISMKIVKGEEEESRNKGGKENAMNGADRNYSRNSESGACQTSITLSPAL
jgi:hypothetical protein